MDSKTLATGHRTDHRNLMQQVEKVVDAIERGDEASTTIHSVADEIICRFRTQLGIYGGRLYVRDGDFYELRATFPDAEPVESGLRIPRSYPPLELCLLRGSVYMKADDPRIDPELEARLGVKGFAAIEVGAEEYVLGFDVAPGHDRDDILLSLGVIRHSVNQKLRQDRVEDIFRQARQIHASILPTGSPEYGLYDIAGKNDSMESVGGDLFDYVPLSDKILGVAIADASGHGLPAALQVRDIYIGLRMGLGREFKIVRTIERLNHIIHESTLTSRFVSLFYGELERNGTFIYVNAGHPPPFHLAASGEVTFLNEGGPVLGPLSDVTYDRGFVHLRPGDLLLLYTDGITETLGRGDEASGEYGVERLLQVARRHQGRSAAEVIEAVFTDLAAWSGDAPPADDRTLVVVVYPRP